MKPLSSKKLLLAAVPMAKLDYYELLRGAGKPCWFIRAGHQGMPLSHICATPAQAWRDAMTGTAAVVNPVHLGIALAEYPFSYAAYLGRGRNKGWIIRDGRPQFYPLTAIRRATQAEAWADLAATIQANQKAVAA